MRLSFICLFILLQTNIFAQDKTFSIHVENIQLDSLLTQIENSFDVRFSYRNDLIVDKTISLDIKQVTLAEILKILDEKHNLKFELISERNIVIRNKTNFISLSEKQILDEIILKNYLTEGIQKQKDGSFKISPKKLEILPGITEPDVFQSIQLLPGIVSPDETSTNIYVRGGTPDQNLILWDDIKIYHSGHLFGTFSVFNPYITKDVKFINKGTDAKYGDRVSSVIDVNTNNDIATEFGGGVGFNLIELDGYFEMPIIEDKLSVLISGRRSFTDLLTSNTYLKLADKVFQNQNTNDILKGVNNFYYLDYNVKMNWKIAENNYINFSFINIENKLQTIFNGQNPLSINDLLETENQGYNFNWSKQWSNKWSHQINTYFSKYDLSFSQINEIDELPIPSIENSNIVKDAGLYINFDYKMSENQNLNFGYQFSNYNIKYALSDTNHDNHVLENESSLNSYALYTSYKYKNKNLFDFTTGFRFSYYSAINSFEFEPRINVFKKLSSDLSIQITTERKTQVVSQINETINQNLTLENQIWTIANKDIPVIKSWQYTGGITYSKNNWNLEFDAYYKKIEGLTTLNRGFIDIDEFSFAKGESVVKGADFYIKKQINAYKTSVSYTLSSVKNNFDGINENQNFPANADITNNINWTHEYSYKKFKFSLGWLWRTGKPYSKATNIIVDDNDELFLKYDGINAYRLPNYYRLDFSSTYNFKISKENNINGKIGFSVLNLLNKENILNRSFYINPVTNEINSVDTRSLQRVSNIVFRVYW
jgi:TonB-dependent receptor-like protein/FecR-like protein